MARPKKNKTEDEVLEQTSAPAVAEPAPEETPAPVAEKKSPTDVSDVTPDIDAHEMSRYFRVINNSEQASRISSTVTRQRELNLWGVHQYTDVSRNSYSRSFYFREHRNAVHALEYAKAKAAE